MGVDVLCPESAGLHVVIGWLRRLFAREDPAEDLISAYVDSDDADELPQVESRLRAGGVDVDELRSVRETAMMLRGLDTVEAPKSYALTPEMLAERGYSDSEIDGILNPRRRWGGLRLAKPAVYVPLVIGALALIGVAVLTIGDITEYATDRFETSSVEREVIGFPGEPGAPGEAGAPGPTGTTEAAALAKEVVKEVEVEKAVEVEKEVVVHTVVVEKEVEVQAEKVVETVLVEQFVEVEVEKLVTVVIEKEIVVEIEKEVVVEVEKEVAVAAEMMEAEAGALVEESSVEESAEAAKIALDVEPIATASVTPTPDPCLVTPASTPMPSLSPTASSSPTVTPTVSLIPTCTPTPTPTPSPTPTPMPTQPATASPTSTSVVSPTPTP